MHNRATSLLAFLCLLLTPSWALATWSVIAVDQRTGAVVIASATCVPQASLERFPADGLMDIQAIVVPGVGVAAAQAGVDRTRANQELIHRELLAGTSPSEIMEMLADDPRFAHRQFAILDLQGRRAVHTGAENGEVALHASGAVEGVPVFFSVQGNILAAPEVVHDAVAAFRSAEGRLTDRVMAAMEAADARGGDRRCNCETEPLPDAPCSEKTAHVAYILEALPDDVPGEDFNDGDWNLYLSVTDRDIGPDEDANPVKTLRMRYEAARH